MDQVACESAASHSFAFLCSLGPRGLRETELRIKVVKRIQHTADRVEEGGSSASLPALCTAPGDVDGESAAGPVPNGGVSVDCVAGEVGDAGESFVCVRFFLPYLRATSQCHSEHRAKHGKEMPTHLSPQSWQRAI